MYDNSRYIDRKRGRKMTKEKCKEVLQALWRYKDCGYSENEIRESLDMAIKALEQQKPIEKFENAKDHIFKLAGDYKCWDNRLTHDEALELCHILEQEPCEDCVSRKKLDKALYEHFHEEDSPNNITEVRLGAVRNFVKNFPSVTPTRKKGKWINKSHTSDCGIKFVASECTCCGKRTFFDCDQLVYNYCPNCGSFMSEVEE
jgi:hypothetical protein